MTFPIRIGTRRSALALTQSGMMQRAIAAAMGPIMPIATFEPHLYAPGEVITPD